MHLSRSTSLIDLPFFVQQLPPPRATQCWLFGIPGKQTSKKLKPMSKKQEKRFNDIVGNACDIGLLVLDEGSFNDITILAHISARMMERRNSPLPFAGVPVLLLLDFHQKQCVGGTQLHKALIVADLPDDLLQELKVNGKGKSKITIGHFGADRIGVDLMRRFQRFDLVQQMRASDDPIHTAHISEIRDIFSKQPISESILDSLQPLTLESLALDPKLQFARIVAMSWREVYPLTVLQITRWARTHNLPVIRWRKILTGTNAEYISEDETKNLFMHESSGLYEYFVAGMPGTFTQNIDTQNGIVNGGKNTYFSITMDEGSLSVDELINAAAEEELNWSDGVLTVTLKVRPLSINVKMVVPRDQAERMTLKNYLLPNPPDNDSSNLGDGLRTVHLALALMNSGFSSDTYNTTSVWASTENIPTDINVQMFPTTPDFVVTDFKVQGTTEQCLISILRPRKHPPNFTVQSFNVQFSRVTMGKNFYALGLDKDDMDHLRCLRHNPALIIWEQSYDKNGHWNQALALAAAQKLAHVQQQPKLKKKIKQTGYKKSGSNKLYLFIYFFF